jgi:hypothetical protein
MTSKIVKNLAASIRAKLLAHAKQHRDDFGRVLTRYAIERLLFRLSQTDAAKHYVLKGAMLFVTWPELDFGRFRRREREHFPCAARYGTEFLYCLGWAGT